MSYIRPIVAFGKTDEAASTSPVSVGDVSISLDNSGGEFVVGSQLFVSNSTNTNIQFLGDATAVDATSVTFEPAVENALGVNAKVWKPTTFHRFTIGPGINTFPLEILGTVVEPTRGGRIKSTKFANSLSAHILSWTNLDPVNYQGFLEFVRDSRGGSSKPFSLGIWTPYNGSLVDQVRLWITSPDRKTNLLESSPLPLRIDPDQYQFILSFIVETADTYVGS